MRTTYITVLTHKTSTYNGSAHAQDFYIQRFCSWAQLLLQFSRTRLLYTTVLLMRTTYITVKLMRKTSIYNGSAHAHNLYYSSAHAQDFY